MDKHEKKFSLTNAIKKYSVKLDDLNNSCININTDAEFKDLFKGIIIIFIKDIIVLYNKILIKLPDLTFSSSSEKITNLNILLGSLEGDGKIYGFDVTDIMLRAYITYFYIKYRDYMMSWDIEAIKNINEDNIESVIVDTASKEQVTNEVSEYLNIIPEVVLMINNLSEKDIVKIFYLTNNVNTIIDNYLNKKSQNQLSV
jgi:hypothetical protein